MAFWEQNLVVAAGSTVLAWSPRLLFDGGPENSFDVCLTLLIPPITALATVSDSLVVGSAEYHTAQIYAQNGARVARAIGHTAGITALHSFDVNQFLSGSADQTVKLWDLRVPVPVVNILRHDGIVTALYGDAAANPNLVISGGTDGVVRGWDIRAFQHLFTLSVGQCAPQSIDYSAANQKLTVVVSENQSDLYYDMQKFGPPNPDIQVLDAPLNAVLSFQFALA
jgi:WD40 repeat protein